MKLSLIITYRQREKHLKTQITWWKSQINHSLLSKCELIIVEADQAPSSWILNEIASINGQYIYLPCPNVFHKTKALNLGLANAKGDFIAPFDVDLIPVKNTLEKHIRLASHSPSCLISGYRIMYPKDSLDINKIDQELLQTTIAPEDQPTALWKHLIKGEKFGVVPFFNRFHLLEIGGWDENFIGWGAEDQDIIERYLNLGYDFCRSSELVYLHLAHQPCSDWNEDLLTQQNRQYYYAKMQERLNPNF